MRGALCRGPRPPIPEPCAVSRPGRLDESQTLDLSGRGPCAIPRCDLFSRYDADAILAIRKRLLAAGLPMRAVHVLIRLGFEWPDDFRAALLEDEPGESGLRSKLLNARNCGPGTLACVETWLNLRGKRKSRRG